MRRVAAGLLALVLLRADMYPDASNAKLPEARRNLDTGMISVKDFGAVGDAMRVPCLVTSTASSAAVTVAPGNFRCAFAAADVGKRIVILNAGSTATTPLATTISGVTDATHLTLAAPAGQTLAASSQYVTWGTDDSAAINAAYLQAAQQTDAGGQQGYVYFPPLPKPQPNTPQIRCWGAASQINTAPGFYQIDTQGAGREASQVCALSPMPVLVNGSEGFSRGAGFRDIGFDGNTLAADVMKFVCSAHGRLTNVHIANPAAGGRGLNIGPQAGCNTTMTFGLYVIAEGAFYPSPATYPDNLIYIDNSDTQHYGLIAVGPATTASIHLTANAGNTVLFAPHLWGQYGTYGIRSLAPWTQIYFPQIDWGTGPNIGVSMGGGSAGFPGTVHGGHVLAPGPAAIAVQIESGTKPIMVTGFYCGNFGTPANCIKEITPDGNNLIYGNYLASQVPITVEVANQSPAAPTSAANFTFMGLNTTFTPGSSGVLDIVANLVTSNSLASNGVQYKIVVGYGAVPTNGQNCVTGGGTTIWTQGTPQTTNGGNVGQYIPLSLKLNGGGYRGTAYWADLCGKLTAGGVASVFNVDLKVKEDGLRQ